MKLATDILRKLSTNDAAETLSDQWSMDEITRLTHMLHMIHEHLGNSKSKAINKHKDEVLSTHEGMRTDVEKAANKYG